MTNIPHSDLLAIIREITPAIGKWLGRREAVPDHNNIKCKVNKCLDCLVTVTTTAHNSAIASLLDEEEIVVDSITGWIERWKARNSHTQSPTVVFGNDRYFISVDYRNGIMVVEKYSEVRVNTKMSFAITPALVREAWKEQV